MIRLLGVSKRYPGGRDAVKNIDLGIARGEFVLLTGHSGAGKSTLLELMAGIERPTTGSVTVSGQNLGRLSRAAMPYLRRRLGLVFQDHKLLFDRNVYDNVALPLRIAGFASADIPKRVMTLRLVDKVLLVEQIDLAEPERSLVVARRLARAAIFLHGKSPDRAGR